MSVLEDHEAVTPAGNPVAVPIPVAPVVEYVILVIAVLIHKVWASVPVAELNETVFPEFTLIAPEGLLVKVQVPFPNTR